MRLLSTREWADAHTGLGEVYLKQGNLRQATHAYKRATRLNRNKNPSAILGLGKVYARQERWDDAITTVEKVN